MSAIVKLLQGLNTDVSLRERYVTDREAIIDEFECNAEEKSALMSNDAKRLREVLDMANADMIFTANGSGSLTDDAITAGDFIVTAHDFIVSPEPLTT